MHEKSYYGCCRENDENMEACCKESEPERKPWRSTVWQRKTNFSFVYDPDLTHCVSYVLLREDGSH